MNNLMAVWPMRFRKAMLWLGVGLGVLYGLGLLGVKMVMAASFPLAGVGGMVIRAPEIDGDFRFAASSSQTDQQPIWPAALMTASRIEFPYGVTLEKNLDFSGTPLAVFGIRNVKLLIETNDRTHVAGGGNAAFEISGMQSDQVSFTTGYDTSGNPALFSASGVHPLSDVSAVTASTFTNVTLNVHHIRVNDWNGPALSVQLVAEDDHGNPLESPNGSFIHGRNRNGREKK